MLEDHIIEYCRKRHRVWAAHIRPVGTSQTTAHRSRSAVPEVANRKPRFAALQCPQSQFASPGAVGKPHTPPPSKWSTLAERSCAPLDKILPQGLLVAARVCPFWVLIGEELRLGRPCTTCSGFQCQRLMTSAAHEHSIVNITVTGFRDRS
jgi:hypothetical protein